MKFVSDPHCFGRKFVSDPNLFLGNPTPTPKVWLRFNPGGGWAALIAGHGNDAVSISGTAMNHLRRSLLATFPLLVAGAALGTTASAIAHDGTSSWVSGGIAGIEIIDRASGETLGVHPWRGDRFVVGTPGNEYRLRIRNLTGARILAVTSVDGVNVVSGDTASPAQSGYVLGAWQTLDIDGWRTSLQQTAAFYFTEHANSYAARTGRPNDVGVIGVAVFRERPRVMEDEPKVSRDGAADASAAGRMDKRREAGAERAAKPSVAQRAMPSAPSLGTGYGRDETSHAQRVAFERATAAPAEVLAVRYDSQRNLLAMGVLPRPRIIGRAPDPFPGSFVAPPPY